MREVKEKGGRAKSLLDKNRGNIASKVRRGETLSAFEIRILEQEASAAKGPEFAKNQVELAKVLRCERKTIQRAAKKPGAPRPRSDGRWPVTEWKAFLEAQGSITSNDPDKMALQAEQLLLQNQRLKNKLAIERKEWIPRVIARQVFTQLVTEAKARSFNSIIRLVTLARVAPDSNTAAEEVRKEVEQVWRSLENSEWYRPGNQNGKEQNATTN